jgi:hypothetical protein
MAMRSRDSTAVDLDLNAAAAPRLPLARHFQVGFSRVPIENL